MRLRVSFVKRSMTERPAHKTVHKGDCETREIWRNWVFVSGGEYLSSLSTTTVFTFKHSIHLGHTHTHFNIMFARLSGYLATSLNLYTGPECIPLETWMSRVSFTSKMWLFWIHVLEWWKRKQHSRFVVGRWRRTRGEVEFSRICFKLEAVSL